MKWNEIPGSLISGNLVLRTFSNSSMIEILLKGLLKSIIISLLFVCCSDGSGVTLIWGLPVTTVQISKQNKKIQKPFSELFNNNNNIKNWIEVRKW